MAAGTMPSSSEVASVRRAAKQGDAVAQLNLGVMYIEGNGVPKGAAKAVEWYRKGAEQGHRLAQYRLGNMYYHGDGVPKDLVQAHMWSNLAGSSGDERARENRQEAESQMTKEQVAEAEKLARKWYEAHRGERR
jgi:TPR repeat protein